MAISTHLFRVLEVLEECALVPGNALVDVGSGVRETLALAGLAAEDTGSCRRMSTTVRDGARKHSRLTRGGWGRLCGARLQRGYGTERNGS